MRNNLIQALFNAGANDQSLPPYLLRRVRSTNVTTLGMIFFVTLPFIIISLIYMPPLAIIPLVGAFTCIGAIAANFLGGFRYSRLFVSILPVWEATLYNAMLCNPGDAPVSSIYLFSISMMLAPFVMFDLKEKGFLIVSLLLSSLCIFMFPLLCDWFTVDYDAELVQSYVKLLETGWLNYVTVCSAVVTAIGFMLGLAIINRNAERESEAMRQETEMQKEQLQQEKVQREQDMQQLQQAQVLEKKRQWTNEGLTNLSDILRGNFQEQEMFDSILSMMVKNLRANQGGLYVVDNDEDDSQVRIGLKSCYAYGRKKFMEKQFAPGEGLLGQAYLEEEAIHMTELPQDYTTITSGLGEATPSALLIVPLKVNDTVEGMLEMASFNKFEAHELEFIHKAGESIAAYIQNNRVNTQTKVLLEKAHEQTAQLREQEEEMRQNMEELSATQEEMRRKEQEYQRIIQELQSAATEM